MQPLLEAAINGWWQGIVLTLFVWLVLRDLPRVSAATRVAIWQVTMAMVLLLPLLQRVPMPSFRMEPIPSAAVSRINPTASPAPAVVEPVPQPAPAARVSPLIEVDNAEVFAGIAMLLAGLALLRLAFGYWAIRRLKRRASALEDTLPVSVKRPVDVKVSSDIAMPMAVGYRCPAILLPQSMLSGLTPGELRHVLLHESAHLRRRDDWAALAERFLRALFVIQPAMYFIGRQIEKEREIACDDWVVDQAGEAKPYACSLARLAELGSSRRAPILAAGVGGKKQIFSRLETLLDRTRNNMPAVSEPLVLLAGLLLLVAVSQGSRFNQLFGLSGFSNNWVMNDGNQRREIRSRGDIRYTPDDKDVESMSPGSKLLLGVSDYTGSRRVEYEANDQGVVARRYFVDGAEHPFDAAAQRFAAGVLEPFVREQGGHIPERLARITQDKGVEGAIDDIRTLHGDEVKRGYLEELFRQSTLNRDQMRRALRIASEIHSDDEKRRFLEPVMSSLMDQDLVNQVADYIDSIHSDDNRQELLVRGLESAKDAGVVRLIRSAGRMNSDDNKTNVLMRAADASKHALGVDFYDAVSSVHSDDQRGRLLSAALSSHAQDPNIQAQVMSVASRINSDEVKGRIVAESAPSFRGNDANLPEASRLLASIHSSSERRAGLEALLAADGKNPGTLRMVLANTAGINSDEDKAKILVTAADVLTEEEQIRRSFFGAVNGIHSSGEQRRVLLAVLTHQDWKHDMLDDIARSASRMNSSEDREAVTRVLAGRR